MKKETRQEVRKVDFKNMSETEKEMSKIFGTLLLKKAIIPFVLIFTVFFASKLIVTSLIIRLVLALLVMGASFFYLKNYRDKLQNLKYYEGKVIYLQKKDNNYELLLKNGKLPIKLTIAKGVDDKKARQNHFVKLYYNASEKVAIICK